jgi:hypothetical protein
MRYHSGRVVLLCGLLLLQAGAVARAEEAEVDSFELEVADADSVVVGKVVKVETAIADGHEYDVLTVAVSEIFKGPSDTKVTFVQHALVGAVARDWMVDGVPLLFCLVKREHLPRDHRPPGQFPWVLHAGPLLMGQAKRAEPHTAIACTRDFKVLKDPAEIVRRVERTLCRLPRGKPVERHGIDVPDGTAVWDAVNDDSAVTLFVPVDEQLEELGRSWAASPDFIRRIEAARMLRHFKNERNIRILKSLLKDPGYSVENESWRCYDVRREAYEALQEFGVPVAQPVLRKKLRDSRK